jgi:hypothetical protein
MEDGRLFTFEHMGRNIRIPKGRVFSTPADAKGKEYQLGVFVKHRDSWDYLGAGIVFGREASRQMVVIMLYLLHI